MAENNIKPERNVTALIAFALLVVSAFLFPLFGKEVLGQNFTNKNTVLVNLIGSAFNSQNLNTTFGIMQLIMIILFLLIALFYLLNGLGVINYKYSNTASILTFVYLIVGLFAYNTLRNETTASIFGIEITSVTFGLGIYFVAIVGLFYLIFARPINKAVKI